MMSPVGRRMRCSGDDRPHTKTQIHWNWMYPGTPQQAAEKYTQKEVVNYLDIIIIISLLFLFSL